MQGFKREDLLFSLCGLNCGLCPMQFDGYCPGCGGGAGNQSCAIARCSLQQGKIVYCSQCAAFPCEKYASMDSYDSFITHQHQRQDLQKLQLIGQEAYWAEQQEKKVLLDFLLEYYNDGRRKSFFAVAVNLLELSDLNKVIQQLKQEFTYGASVKERAAQAVDLLQTLASERGIVCKLRKKPGKK